MLKKIFGKAASDVSNLAIASPPQSATPLNNFWYKYNESDTVFIFVHGFFSNSIKCWTSTTRIYWPDLVVADPRFGGPAIFMAGYYTDVDSGFYEVADCAKEVFDAIRRPGINGEIAPLDKSNIVFVCHSLGGIVTRYLIENNREAFKEKAIGLILMASPSLGSDYANSLKSIAQFYKNRIANQLKAANPSLRDLDDRFKSLLEKKIISKLVGAEAVEHHFPLHWKWLPGFKPIVEKESAARYFGNSRVLPNTDHSTCVKPDSSNHVAHQFLVSTYIEKFLPVKISTPALSQNNLLANSQPSKKNLESATLFEIYDPSHEPYYVQRNIDQELASCLSLFSLWVYGESGVGKTTAVRREVFSVSKYAIQAYIGAAVNEGSGHEGMLKEIYYTVSGKLEVPYKKLDNAHQVVTELANLLADHSKISTVFLVLDEVPLLEEQPDEMEKFIVAVYTLIILIKQKTGQADLRLIVTSIFDPTAFISPSRKKIAEQIRFIHFDRWTDCELRSLIDRIESVMPTIPVENGNSDKILRHALGSPRFVKTLYKNYRLTSHSSQRSVDVAINQTKLALGNQHGA